MQLKVDLYTKTLLVNWTDQSQAAQVHPHYFTAAKLLAGLTLTSLESLTVPEGMGCLGSHLQQTAHRTGKYSCAFPDTFRWRNWNE